MFEEKTHLVSDIRIFLKEVFQRNPSNQLAYHRTLRCTCARLPASGHFNERIADTYGHDQPMVTHFLIQQHYAVPVNLTNETSIPQNS